MGKLLMRSSGLSAPADVVAVPSTSLQGGTTPPPLSQEPHNDEVQDAVLHKAIQGLRKHVPELYRQLRAGTQFHPGVLKIIIDIVDKANGGTPWPVALALKAVRLLADNEWTIHDSAAADYSLASTFEEVKRTLQRLEDFGVRDEHQDQVKEITAKLIAASAIVDDIVRKTPPTWTCGTIFCCRFNAIALSDVLADLEKFLGSIRDIIAYHVERPCAKSPELPSHLVWMDERVSKVMGFLRDSGGSSRVLGLHGQAGIGKTTLMSAVEAKLKSHLQDDDGSRTIHEIASVEVGVRPLSLKSLQNSLYIQLSGGRNESFSSEAQGRAALKDLIKKLKGKGKKICVFLDDVWELEHLTILLPLHDLADALPHGSYLLISSRSADVAAGLAGMCFKTQQEEERGYLGYQLPLLLKQDAEDLFLRNASRAGEEEPLQRNNPLVQAIVPRCDGLPLALTVFGSFFKDGKRRKPDVWKKVLEQLKRVEGDPRTFCKLKVSVDFQDKRLQDVFLDAALLSRFVSSYEDSKDAVFCNIDEALELVMEDYDLEFLVDQSLFTRRGKRVTIHEHLRYVAVQMAWERNIWAVTNDISKNVIDDLLRPYSSKVEIVESVTQRSQVSSIKVFDERAWCRHAKNYPSSAQMEEVIYLRLNGTQGHPLVNLRREFLLMITKHCHKLRMLEVQVEDTLEDALVVQEQLSWIENLRQLRWLSMEGCRVGGISQISSELRSFNMCVNNNGHVHHDFLRSLKASFTTLRRLCIKGLDDAMQLQSVWQLGSLTELDLSGCTSLAELPKELGQVDSLMQLDLSECRSLAELPRELGQLDSLTQLDLSECTSLTKLPKELGQLGSLMRLDLFECTRLAELPKEIGQLDSLIRLDLSGCTWLAELPKELGLLGSLTLLDISGCTRLAELPKELGQLGSLMQLDILRCTSLVELPKELGQLGSLIQLDLSECTSLAELPKEFGLLGSLTHFDLSGCTSLAELPQELGELGSLTFLGLSGCTSLAKLPKKLGQLGSLMQLDLPGCMSLAELPTELGQVDSVMQLDLSGCTSLVELPKELGQLGSLMQLDLPGCMSLAKLPKELGQLGSLTQLDLSRCTSLTKLPKELGQLGSLTQFDLSGCTSLAELPKELGQLCSLMWLSFSGCTSLAKLPQELGQLGSLTRLLNLSGCTSLAKLPKELGQFVSLTHLDLSGCTSLEELPKQLGELGSLTWLSLSGCTSLAELPTELGQLGSLTRLLDLSRCTSLEELPKELGQLGSLTLLLDLSGCTSLIELPKEFGQLSSLTELDLSGCTSLAKLPKELGQLGSLTWLSLSGCTSLVELPKELGQLGSLTRLLDLSRCTSLVELPKELGQLGSLTRLLDISGCTSLVNLPEELGLLGSLTHLDLSGCTSLAELPKELGQLGSLTQLLDLSGCTSLAKLPEELGQLGSLTELDLSRCTSLLELPKELGQLGSLTWLSLSGCTNLEELPKELGQLGSLTRMLDLSGCTSLKELPKELGQLGSLRRLNLSGCTRLAELPHELGELGSLTQLDLSGCTSLAELHTELGQLAAN